MHERLSMTTFKTFALFSFATVAAGAVSAQDLGRVISSQPILQQVAFPRQVCTNQQIEVQQQKSGAGAAMGAIAGGAMGNAVGRGAGNAAATVVGIVGGAILGDRIEGAPATRLENIQNCSNQTFYENKTVGYNVVYEFGGRQYSVQMPNDPGPTIAVQVSPVGVQSPNPYQGNAVAPSPVYQQPSTVIESRTVYQPYYPRPYYIQTYVPPIRLNFGYGHWGGGHHNHHRH